MRTKRLEYKKGTILVSINTVAEDNQSKSYKVIFSAGGFDYSVRLVINNTMQPYLLYV